MKITSDLLAKLVPGTSAAKRDRFLPFLNDALRQMLPSSSVYSPVINILIRTWANVSAFAKSVSILPQFSFYQEVICE